MQDPFVLCCPAGQPDYFGISGTGVADGVYISGVDDEQQQQPQQLSSPQAASAFAFALALA